MIGAAGLTARDDLLVVFDTNVKESLPQLRSGFSVREGAKPEVLDGL